MSLISLPTDVTALNTLAPKEAGSLIKPADWNALIGSVQGIGTALQEYIAQTNTRLTTLENAVTPLNTRVDTLEQDLADLQTSIAPLLDQFVVTLRTSKSNYALGELCEITAEVRDLTGNIVTSRPWIDFVTTWGQLQAATGFTTSLSANGGSISVQANAQGIARVRVKAAHAENLNDTQELQVAGALETALGNGQFFYQAIMEAPTPASQTAVQAFGLMNSQYEVAQNNAMQLFVDSYQLFPQYQILPQFNFGNWKHYRTVVVALAKPDSDPTTADSSKGSASIQVNFRDWVGPWIDFYTKNFSPFVPDLVLNFNGQLGNGSFQADLGGLQDMILTDLNPLGAVGRQRYYNAAVDAMDKVNPAAPLTYMADLRNTVKQAVTVQQIQEVPGGALKGNQFSKVPAMAAINGVSSHAASAKAAADATQGSVQVLQASSQDLNNRVLAINNDLQTTQQMSTVINRELGSIGQNVLRINTLDQNSVQGQINLITAQIGQINEVLRRG